MFKITPLLLAGGLGTRLWPLSRKSYPKQFSKLIGDTTLFQQTALRFRSSNKVCFEPPCILTNADFRFIVGDQLQEIRIKSDSIIIEPEAKNTAPGILAASIFSFQRDENAILIAAPTDHLILDNNAFHSCLSLAVNEVQNGKIVTFGITPTRPENGYGYLKIAHSNNNLPTKLLGFVEKPTIAKAKQMIKKGNYLWNSGVFMFKAKDMIDAFKVHYPSLLSPVKSALKNSQSDLDFCRLEPKNWSKCKNISIDFAIMEKLNNLITIPFSGGWSDLGEWNSVWENSEKNSDGVALSKNAHEIDCKNSLLRSENESQQIVGIGLRNIIAISMNDAVLVANKNCTQDIKQVVEHLKSKNISQADVFPRDHRPWGWFEVLALSKTFQVKKISVKPGAALSLQSHKHRSEHWVVVSGTAKVTVDDKTELLNEGESTFIPIGSVHRLENKDKSEMVLIEIQIGKYLGEDDITRYEDLYSRTQP